MAGDDLFKRYLEIGASVLGMSRERAESIVKDLVASGEVARGQATKAADWLVERGRAGTEELAELVRREVRQQVAALGLATKDDVARLEAQLAESRQAAANAATPTAAASANPKPTPTGGARKAAAASRPVAKKQVAKKPAIGTPTATARKASPAEAPKAAGITRSGSVRRRSGGSGSSEPDPGPPAGGPRPPKG